MELHRNAYVMNLMRMGVKECIREISIGLTTGARQGDIQHELMPDAVLETIVGGSVAC